MKNVCIERACLSEKVHLLTKLAPRQLSLVAARPPLARHESTRHDGRGRRARRARDIARARASASRSLSRRRPRGGRSPSPPPPPRVGGPGIVVVVVGRRLRRGRRLERDDVEPPGRPRPHRPLLPGPASAPRLPGRLRRGRVPLRRRVRLHRRRREDARDGPVAGRVRGMDERRRRRREHRRARARDMGRDARDARDVVDARPRRRVSSHHTDWSPYDPVRVVLAVS